MGASERKQRAELRVVLRRGSSYALALRATIRGEDLYCAVDREPRGEVLRTSWHSSGATHTYVYGSKRVPYSKGTPLREFTGKLRLWGASSDPDDLDWSYRPKKDSAWRRTLVVDVAEVCRPFSIDCWAVEAERDDLIGEAFAESRRFNVVVSSIRIEWSRPQLLAIVTRPRPELLASIDAIVKSLNALPARKLI